MVVGYQKCSAFLDVLFLILRTQSTCPLTHYVYGIPPTLCLQIHFQSLSGRILPDLAVHISCKGPRWQSPDIVWHNACAAADRKGFARKLGQAIRRPSSMSDIPVTANGGAAAEKPATAQFPPAYEDPSFPPSFARDSRSRASVAHPIQDRSEDSSLVPPTEQAEPTC
jgi:hypothetical protein